jgi:hypothetical protein
MICIFYGDPACARNARGRNQLPPSIARSSSALRLEHLRVTHDRSPGPEGKHSGVREGLSVRPAFHISAMGVPVSLTAAGGWPEPASQLLRAIDEIAPRVSF